MIRLSYLRYIILQGIIILRYIIRYNKKVFSRCKTLFGNFYYVLLIMRGKEGKAVSTKSESGKGKLLEKGARCVLGTWAHGVTSMPEGCFIFKRLKK